MNGRSKKTSLQKLRQCLLDLKPHPSEMYRVIEEQLPPLESFVSPEVLEADGYGMTEEQLRNLASEPLFTIGAHTVDHPLLTRCTAAESRRQIFDGKAWIEQVTGSQCKLFAYPGADYDDSLIELCREAGFRMAFGVNPKPVSLEYLAIPRVGVYGQSLFRLQLKIWYGMRKLGHVLRAGYGLQRPISTN